MALFDEIVQVSPPARLGADEPSLTSKDGALYISWLEHDGEPTMVTMSNLQGRNWAEARQVHEGADLVVNWADLPGVAVFENGTIAGHWLQEIGGSSYNYVFEIALLDDGDASWSDPLAPHEDRSSARHGYVSMMHLDEDRLAPVWLDGRAFGATSKRETDLPDAMQLRATTLTSVGVLDRDVAIGLETCSCCQTGLSATGNGTILAAYRDRREGEIRDISVAQLSVVGWQVPSLVYHGVWELPGCPDNGPAIAAYDDTASVAWFTGAGSTPAVKVAFSEDAGKSFGVPVGIDQGDSAGRVDLQLLEDNSALVSWVEWVEWVEWIEGPEALMVCRVNRTAGCAAPEILSTNTAVESVNFPRMARSGREVCITWTQPDLTGDRVEMRRAALAEAE